MTARGPDHGAGQGDEGSSDTGHQGQSGRKPHPTAVTIRCREHGPLVVELPTDESFRGLGLRVTDHHGREFSLPPGKPLVALCRCGRSSRRPFCDGTHAVTGFHAPETAPEP